MDLRKRLFQLHGARADGTTAFRKKVTRSQVLKVLAELPKSLVVMEACATANEMKRSRNHGNCRSGPPHLTGFRGKNKACLLDCALAKREDRPCTFLCWKT